MNVPDERGLRPHLFGWDVGVFFAGAAMSPGRSRRAARGRVGWWRTRRHRLLRLAGGETSPQRTHINGRGPSRVAVPPHLSRSEQDARHGDEALVDGMGREREMFQGDGADHALTIGRTVRQDGVRDGGLYAERGLARLSSAKVAAYAGGGPSDRRPSMASMSALMWAVRLRCSSASRRWLSSSRRWPSARAWRTCWVSSCWSWLRTSS